jgi:hypothetical protein
MISYTFSYHAYQVEEKRKNSFRKYNGALYLALYNIFITYLVAEDGMVKVYCQGYLSRMNVVSFDLPLPLCRVCASQMLIRTKVNVHVGEKKF